MITLKTVVDEEMKPELLGAYYKALVNRFFKILPMRESGEKSLPDYIRSLQSELLGIQRFVTGLNEGAMFTTLLGILEFLHDEDACSVRETKREVFRAISLCNKLEAACGGSGD